MPDIYSILGDEVHTNEVTGCIIWTGDLDRAGQPVTVIFGSKNRIRDLIVKASGNEVRRGAVVKPSCENERCVKAEHFLIEVQAVAPEVEYTDEELEAVRSGIAQGLRQDFIASQLNTSRSRVAKIAKVLKDREASNGTQA